MSRTDNETLVTPSVLDRLLDHEPRVPHEPASARAETLRRHKASVRRDLEWLLNTRRMVEHLPPEMKELGRSLAAYGLPDFSDARMDGAPEGVRRELEAAVNIFEPRLRGVTVGLAAASETERVMVFQIEAWLDAEPDSAQVTFGAALDLDTGEFKVREAE